MYTYIGCGINLIEASGPYAEYVTKELFIPDIYKNGIDHIPAINSDFKSLKSFASDEFHEKFDYKSILGNEKASEAIALFSGGIELKYAKTNSISTMMNCYYTGSRKIMDKYAIAAEFSNPLNMKKIVKPEVLDDINNSDITPEVLFKRYGTHIIIDAGIGGMIEICGTYNSKDRIDDNDFKVSLDAAFKYIKAHGRVDRDIMNKKYVKDTIISVHVYGGDAFEIPEAEVGIADEFIKNYNDWVKSVNKNPTLSQVNKYQNIWELADSKERSEQIEEAFYKLAKERYNFVSKYFSHPEVKKVGLVVQSNYNMGIPHGGTLGVNLDNIYYTTVNMAEVTGLRYNSSNTFIMYKNDDDTVSFFNETKNLFLTVHVNSVLNNIGVGNMNQLYLLSNDISVRQKFRLEKHGELYKIKSVLNDKYIQYKQIMKNSNAKDYWIVFTANADYDKACNFRVEEI